MSQATKGLGHLEGLAVLPAVPALPSDALPADSARVTGGSGEAGAESEPTCRVTHMLSCCCSTAIKHCTALGAESWIGRVDTPGAAVLLAVSALTVKATAAAVPAMLPKEWSGAETVLPAADLAHMATVLPTAVDSASMPLSMDLTASASDISPCCCTAPMAMDVAGDGGGACDCMEIRGVTDQPSMPDSMLDRSCMGEAFGRIVGQGEAGQGGQGSPMYCTPMLECHDSTLMECLHSKSCQKLKQLSMTARCSYMCFHVSVLDLIWVDSRSQADHVPSWQIMAHGEGIRASSLAACSRR